MFSALSASHVPMHLNLTMAEALWEKPVTSHDEPLQQRTEKPAGPVSLLAPLHGGQRFESRRMHVSQRSMLSHELGAQIHKLGLATANEHGVTGAQPHQDPHRRAPLLGSTLRCPCGEGGHADTERGWWAVFHQTRAQPTGGEQGTPRTGKTSD